MTDDLSHIEDPRDYFTGVGHGDFEIPNNLLLYVRRTKSMLQQQSLKNRSHHRIVLAFNLETKGQVHVNSFAFPFAPGQALLILPFQFHHFSHLESMGLKWFFCTFELRDHTFLEPLRNRVVNTGATTQRIRRELAEGWKCRQTELDEFHLQAILARLLISMRKDREKDALDLPAEVEDSLLRKVNRLLIEHPGRSLQASDIARIIGYSPSRFRVLFKETSGVPIGTYIRNLRINQAMALLRTSNMAVSDLAEEAGFSSPQAFCRIFKKATGQTPREYRVNKR